MAASSNAPSSKTSCVPYGLGLCEVAPDLGEEGLPLRALGLAGASFLRC